MVIFSLDCTADRLCVILNMSLKEQWQHNWVKHLVNIWLGREKKQGCTVRMFADCSKEFRPEGIAIVWCSDFFLSAAILRNSKTFKVEARSPELKEPSQQSRWNALETHQCLSTLKTSAQLFLWPVPCGKLVLIKQLLLQRGNRRTSDGEFSEARGDRY